MELENYLNRLNDIVFYLLINGATEPVRILWEASDMTYLSLKAKVCALSSLKETTRAFIIRRAASEAVIRNLTNNEELSNFLVSGVTLEFFRH